ncbi:MAG: cobalamin-binding protein [Acidimicrobiia bacterium]
MRIVSLLPSATEVLFALGKGGDVVGRTHECDHPEGVSNIPTVTRDLLPPGLVSAAIDSAVADSIRDQHTIYQLDVEALLALDPDVVITQSVCGVCAVPTALVEDVVCTMPRRARVVSADPHTLEEVLESIIDVGEAVGAPADARRVVEGLRARLQRLASAVEGRPRPTTAVVEWPDPVYTAGHWVPEMVGAAGGRSVLGDGGRPSVPVALERLVEAKPEVVVLAFCGFDLAETLPRFEEVAHSPQWKEITASARTVAVDGSSYFSRPGPRVVDGVELLAWALHRPHPSLRPPEGRAAELATSGWVDLAAA